MGRLPHHPLHVLLKAAPAKHDYDIAFLFAETAFDYWPPFEHPTLILST
jgi:hypothetical protein